MFKPHLLLAIAALLPAASGARSAEPHRPASALPRKPGVSLPVQPAAKPTPTELHVSQASCRNSVQSFYDWYLPRLMREVRTPAMKRALNARSSYFSPQLRRGLTADLAASAKSPDEIVGLDFDPFVNSQDPAARYVVKKAYRVERGYRVEVHGVIDGKANEAPDVIPEVVLSHGHWMFVNFHYPAEGTEPKTDLLKVLRVLRDSRHHPAERSAPRR
jgi:hypothetical protein